MVLPWVRLMLQPCFLVLQFHLRSITWPMVSLNSDAMSAYL